MNMTVVIISKRSMELMLLLATLSLASLTINLTHGVSGHMEPVAGEGQTTKEIPATIQLVADESKVLDEQTLESITKELGKHLSDTMSSEMEQLLQDMDEKQARRKLRETPKKHQTKPDEAKLDELVAANRAASEDIRARIELVGDNSGKLPQMSFGSAANSLLTVASDRLASAGSFIGSKMRSLSAHLSEKLPPRLKRFFRWPGFFNFKVRFHKRYGTLREELYRNFIFLKNQIVVNMQHIRFIMRRDSHVLGQTQYSDMTETEYRDAVGNEEAADDKPEFEVGKADRAKMVANMKALAASNKNVHGQAAGGGNHRAKRSAFLPVVLEDDEDELNETEDDDILDEGAFGLKKGSASGGQADDDEEDDLEAFKLVDEFAGDVDLSQLDDTLKDLDAALEPSSFEPIDLRQTGCVITPENQYNCGCCYAIVSTTLAAYHECMGKKENRAPRRFHARFVSDCGRYIVPEHLGPVWVRGCSGGRPTKALEFAQVAGIPLFSSYLMAQVSAGLFNPPPKPNTPSETGPDRDSSEGGNLRGDCPAKKNPVGPPQIFPRDECAFPKPTDISRHEEWPIPLVQFDFLKKVRIIKLDIAEVDLHLRTVGPVLVSVRMWPKFEQYAAGVYDQLEEPTNGRVDLHSMMVVGHDYDSQGREIYIIWNSHGTAWGERGYLKITAEALDNYAITFLGTLPVPDEEPSDRPDGEAVAT